MRKMTSNIWQKTTYNKPNNEKLLDTPEFLRIPSRKHRNHTGEDQQDAEVKSKKNRVRCVQGSGL